MAKEKVYKLAQEFKVSSEALVQLLRGMGIPVKSHMSTVDDSLRDEIKKKFEQERSEIKKEYERKKQIMVRAKEDQQVKADEAAAAAAVLAAPAEAFSAPAVPASGAAGSQEAHAPAAHAVPHPPITTLQSPAAHTIPRSLSTSSSGHHAEASVTASDTARLRSWTRPETPMPEMKMVPGKGDLGLGGGGGHSGGHHKKKGGKKRQVQPEVNEFMLKQNVRKTLAKIGSGFTRKKYKRDADVKEDIPGEEKKILNVSEFVTVAEMANMMGKSVAEVMAKCLELGMFVTINQRLDFEVIEVLADEFGYEAQLLKEYAAEDEITDDAVVSENLRPRAPVITVMGHVDHGKTSLLDYIRKTNVIAGEAGGITQHIAAYEVKTKHGPVTFLDTPGHEAFTAMRARGSQITDVIVLVVAADSGVMPQTKEAIDHARAATVPLVVAINKVDLPTANVDKVKAELAAYNVVVDSWGGTVSAVEISAKTGQGVDKLLETLALENEILDLKADPTGFARGVVVEAELDKGRGSVATVLIEKGTLKKGDAFVTGIHYGRVRDLLNERGVPVENARPGQPVLVLGLSGTPQAGDSFKAVHDEKEAREIGARRRLAQKERELRRMSKVSLENLYEQIKAGAMQVLNLVIKGDVDGSVEALADSLEKISTDEIKVRVIHKSVGAITETDVMLAAASEAVIIGFHLNPNPKIRDLAKQEGVEMRTFRIIYEAVDAVHAAMEGMLAPEIKETILGAAEVRQVFKVSKVGLIAGCTVTSGTITRGAKAHVIRKDVEIADSRVATLRHIKDDVHEVRAGLECGISIDKFSDYQEGDRIEVYEATEVARKLQ